MFRDRSAKISEASPPSEPSKGLERAVSIAIVTPDPSSMVSGVLNTLSLVATAVSAVNPKAGMAIQTAALLGGWFWNSWKFDRVTPVLEEVSKRIQTVEHEYVRREEFADLLSEVLGRIADQPDPARRIALGNILHRIIDDPREHVENRRIVRIADELPTKSWKVLRAVFSISLSLKDGLWGWPEAIAEEEGMTNDAVRSIVSDIVEDRLMVRDALITMPGAGGPGSLRLLLTPTGEALLKYATE